MTLADDIQTAIDFAKIASPKSKPRGLQQAALDRVLRQMHKQRMQALSLYRPLPHLREFHSTHAIWRICSGSNRSGKTQSCCAELARAIMGRDPYNKYVPKNGNALIIGQDQDSLARLWRTLTEPTFKIIRDEHTGLWRSVRPDANNPRVLDPYDLAYQEKWKDAPPLIPENLWRGDGKRNIAWDDAAKGVPRVFKVPQSGWQSLWRPSGSKPPQGDHYHFVLIDEQIENGEFFAEARRGLVQLSSEPDEWRPKGIWSATVQTENYQLHELLELAAEGSENIKAFTCLIDDNPYITTSGKEAFAEGMTEEERLVRIEGIPAATVKRLYSMFDDSGPHGCDPFEIPEDWARWVVFDPGPDVSATLFVAVDPEEKHRWVYEAFSMRHVDKVVWPRLLLERQGEWKYEGWIIDETAGAQRTLTEDVQRVAEQYMHCAEDAGITPRQRGPLGGFFKGSNDYEARQESLLGWLHLREDEPWQGTPVLQIFRGICPDLVKQIKHAITDPKRPNKRAKDTRKYGRQDLITTLEYAAAFNPRYFPPERVTSPGEVKPMSVREMFDAKKKRKQERALYQLRQAGVLD